ncbi:hypothetical protein S83_058527 [Arachis hypogaea]
MDRFSNTPFLPNDIWVTLTVKVVSNSIQDLCSLIMTCKAARDAGDANIVHRSVSIPPPHATPWWWSRDTEATRFFDRCMAAGHPELLFREALRELFIRRNQDVGFQMLISATSRGHEAAKYALSMTLLLRRDDNDGKWKGLELFCELDAAGLLADCNARCSTRSHMGPLYDNRRRAAERNSVHAFGGVVHIPCIHCRADYELLLFVNLP